MGAFELKKDSIYRELKNCILDGTYGYAHKFPRELDFARELGVGKITLRSALKRLEDDGLLARVPSKGTFVSHDASRVRIRTKNIIAVTALMDRIENPQRYIIGGVKQKTAESGFQLLQIERSYLESMSPSEFRNSCIEKEIDGILLLMSNFNGDEAILRVVQGAALPVVICHAKEADSFRTGFSTVIIDEASAWRTAVEHLCSKGHERIGTIALNNEMAPSFRGHALEQHLELLEKNGADSAPELVKFCNYEAESVSRAIDEYLGLQKIPTAILCYSDFISLYVYEALKSRKISIPRDLAVMGCCGYPGGEFLQPSLSTVDFQYESIGSTSVQLIAEAEQWFHPENRVAPPKIYVEHKLKMRESTNVDRVEKRFNLN